MPTLHFQYGHSDQYTVKRKEKWGTEKFELRERFHKRVGEHAPKWGDEVLVKVKAGENVLVTLYEIRN